MTGFPQTVDTVLALGPARTDVMVAALNLAITEWTHAADDSVDLDHAHDQLDTALHTYAEAHNAASATSTIEPPPVFARKPVTLPVKTAREFLEQMGDEDPVSIDGWTPVATEYIGDRRWVANWMLIIRNEAGEHYASYYDVGLTEYQDTSPWEYETEAQFVPVAPVKTEVIKYALVKVIPTE